MLEDITHSGDHQAISLATESQKKRQATSFTVENMSIWQIEPNHWLPHV